MQIQTTGELIEACLVINEKHHAELLKAFEDRLKGLINYAKCVCKNNPNGRISFEEANQEYWTSHERKNALYPSIKEALDDVTKCQRARESLLRVIQASK